MTDYHWERVEQYDKIKAEAKKLKEAIKSINWSLTSQVLLTVIIPLCLSVSDVVLHNWRTAFWEFMYAVTSAGLTAAIGACDDWKDSVDRWKDIAAQWEQNSISKNELIAMYEKTLEDLGVKIKRVEKKPPLVM